MASSIQVSMDLLNDLKKQKVYPRETYEEVIRNLIEDSNRLSAETKNDLKKSRAEVKEGKVHTLEEIEDELGI